MVQGYIYLLKNKITNKSYVGQTIHLEDRIKDHFRYAYRVYGISHHKRRFDKPLYHSIRKHGKSDFEWYILEICGVEELDEKETFWINHFNTKVPFGYNLSNGGKSTRGYKHSLRTRELISRRNRENAEVNPNYGRKGKPFTEEQRHKISTHTKVSMKIVDHSKLSDGAKKQWENPQFREKMRLLRLGKSPTNKGTTKVDLDLLQKYLNSDMTYREICFTLSISKTTLRRIREGLQ